MKILTFTTLYPDETRARHGIFVEQRVRRLAAAAGISVCVVAPCPWFPFAAPAWGEYSSFARVPAFEERFGLKVFHPRYPLIPKIGMTAAPHLMAWAVGRWLAKHRDAVGDFDLIDAHYFYPDGVAAVMLGQRLGKPVVVTGRGSDLNILPNYAKPRRMIQWAAAHAAGVATVSAALAERLVALGVTRERVTVLRNGVDLALFAPAPCRAGARGDGINLLSVGNLVPVKGHALSLEALALLPEARLTIAGDGPDRAGLEAMVTRLGVGARVSFLGNRPQQDLPALYSAADALVLASTHEGWPNVLLEAMACGTPVVVSDIPGMREIVANDTVGRLFAERTPASLANAIRDLLRSRPAPAAVRAYAEGFGWDAVTEAQIALFNSVLATP